jgi:adenosylhomocysteine nucleosidase
LIHTDFMRTLFVFATRFENQLKKIPEETGEILITGIGKVKAAVQLAKKLQKTRFDRIVNLGICGTVSKAIPLLSIFAINKVIEGDSTGLPAAPAFDLSLIPDNPFPKATLVTQNSVIRTEKQRNHIQALKGDLVDMEGSALAKTALEFKIPFFSFKIVTDYAEEKVLEEVMKNCLPASKELCRQLFKLFFLK